MVSYLILLLEITEGACQDSPFHISGFVENDCQLNAHPAFFITLFTDNDVLLAIKVGCVGDVCHLRDDV